MSDNTIWIVDIMAQHDRTVLGFDSDLYFNDEDKALDAMRRNKRGEPLAEHFFPKEMYSKRAGEYKNGLPSFFLANSFWTISKNLSDAIVPFNLGKTSVYDVKLLDADRKTPLPGEHKCLNLCEFKETFVSGGSPKVRRVQPNIDAWDIPNEMQDDLIAVQPDSRIGVDLWRDKSLMHSLFMTDGLAESIRNAGLAKELGLYRCKNISIH